jgi:hypothetical protein
MATAAGTGHSAAAARLDAAMAAGEKALTSLGLEVSARALPNPSSLTRDCIAVAISVDTLRDYPLRGVWAPMLQAATPPALTSPNTAFDTEALRTWAPPAWFQLLFPVAPHALGLAGPPTRSESDEYAMLARPDRAVAVGQQLIASATVFAEHFGLQLIEAAPSAERDPIRDAPLTKKDRKQQRKKGASESPVQRDGTSAYTLTIESQSSWLEHGQRMESEGVRFAWAWACLSLRSAGTPQAAAAAAAITAFAETQRGVLTGCAAPSNPHLAASPHAAELRRRRRVAAAGFVAVADALRGV